MTFGISSAAIVRGAEQALGQHVFKSHQVSRANLNNTGCRKTDSASEEEKQHEVSKS